MAALKREAVSVSAVHSDSAAVARVQAPWWRVAHRVCSDVRVEVPNSWRMPAGRAPTTSGGTCVLCWRTLIQNALEEETEGNPALTFEPWQTQTATGIARMGGDMKPVCIRRHRRRHAGAASLHVRGTSCVPAALLTPSLSYSQHVSLSQGLASVCRLVLAYPGYGCSQQVGPG